MANQRKSISERGQTMDKSGKWIGNHKVNLSNQKLNPAHQPAILVNHQNKKRKTEISLEMSFEFCIQVDSKIYSNKTCNSI